MPTNENPAIICSPSYNSKSVFVLLWNIKHKILLLLVVVSLLFYYFFSLSIQWKSVVTKTVWSPTFFKISSFFTDKKVNVTDMEWYFWVNYPCNVMQFPSFDYESCSWLDQNSKPWTPNSRSRRTPKNKWKSFFPYVVLNLYDLISSAKYKGDSLNMCISCSFSYSESGWQPEDVELQKSTINVSIWQCTKVFLRHIEKSYLITMITIHLHCMEKWS